VTAQKKSQMTLSQGILKRCHDDDDVDEEVRTTVPSQNSATATLSAQELSIYSSHIIHMYQPMRCGVGAENRRKTKYSQMVSAGFSSLSRISI
jgi:hypothetical protein